MIHQAEFNSYIHPRKPTCHLKRGHFNRKGPSSNLLFLKVTFVRFRKKVRHSNSPTYTFKDCGGLQPRPSFPHPADVVTQVGGVQHDLLEEGREKVLHCEGTYTIIFWS